LSAFVGEILAEADRRGKHLVLVDNQHMQMTSKGLPRVVEERRVDGVIILYDFEDLVPDLDRYKIPWVVLGERGLEHNCVVYRCVTRLAANYLINLGHRRLAYVHHNIPRRLENQRYLGIEQAVEQQPDATLISVATVYDQGHNKELAASAEKICEELFPGGAKQNWPTGVVCDSDWIALAAIKAAKMKGLRVPDDVSIIGNGDSHENILSDPPLTTINYWMSGGASAAVQILLSRMESLKNIPSISTDCVLVERSSSAAPNSVRR